MQFSFSINPLKKSNILLLSYYLLDGSRNGMWRTSSEAPVERTPSRRMTWPKCSRYGTGTYPTHVNLDLPFQSLYRTGNGTLPIQGYGSGLIRTLFFAGAGNFSSDQVFQILICRIRIRSKIGGIHKSAYLILYLTHTSVGISSVLDPNYLIQKLVLWILII